MQLVPYAIFIALTGYDLKGSWMVDSMDILG